ncbi:MAG TPA: hypothetical protein VK446_11230 [Methylocystis sp.]|nr:hypothetical protein [Methylocystis sp.]
MKPRRTWAIKFRPRRAVWGWQVDLGATPRRRTPLDRKARSLLQVRIKDLVEADEIFVKLIRDVVEPRWEFIQEDALSVANLDV